MLALLAAFWRRKWLILFYILVSTLFGGYYAFKVATPLYTASTTLALDVRSQQVVDIESVISGVSTEEEAINTELEVIRSRGILTEIIDRLSLDEDPEFNKTLSPPGLLSGEYWGGENTEHLHPKAVDVLVYQSVRESISAISQRDTYIIQISATTTDSDKSALIANSLSEIYLENQIEAKLIATRAALEWLSERVAELVVEINEKEDAIDDMRTKTDLVNVESLESMNFRVKSLRERFEEAKEERLALEERINLIEALLNGGVDADIVSKINDEALSRMVSSSDIGSGTVAPQIKGRLNALLINEQKKNIRASAKELSLGTALEELKQEVSEQSKDLIQLNQLIRDVEATREIHKALLARMKETSAQIGLQRADSRILSLAVMGEKVSPNRVLILIATFALGLGAGCMHVLVKQLHTSGFRSESEILLETEETVLGAIPTAPIGRRKLHEYLEEKPTSAFAEALRNIRTSIQMSGPSSGCQVIMVTSSIPGEGKTTCSVSLARSFAEIGKNVLLMEGDLRRSVLKEYFPNMRAWDFVELVSGATSPDKAIVKHEKTNLSVLLGKEGRINAANLFSTEECQSFLEKLRSQFDIIVIDCPPVLVVPDARILAPHVDNIVYIVQWETVRKSVVRNGLNQIGSLGISPTGIILSKVDIRKSSSYGEYGSYGNYGGRYYSAD